MIRRKVCRGVSQVDSVLTEVRCDRGQRMKSGKEKKGGAKVEGGGRAPHSLARLLAGRLMASLQEAA